jgi:endonuclease G
MKIDRLRAVAAVLFVSVFATSATLPIRSVSTTTPQESVSVHLTLGNPSKATDSPNDKDNFLMVKDQYVLSFNNSRGGPNWVSWHLQASDIGGEGRGDFHPDDGLPAGFKKIKKADYNNSGFDRGHICNSKDRTDTRANNDATFNMTNILPQGPGNNQGPWVKLENFERQLAQQGNELYIVAGAFGEGGTGELKPKNKPKKLVNVTTIDHGEITVPKTFWKIMVILKAGTNDIDRINASTRLIAVCMPNNTQIRPDDWHKYITTMGNIEAATGYDLLSEVPTTVQAALANKRDSTATGSASKNPCQ